MIAPFCIVVLDLDRVLHDNRTTHYLIDKFNARFCGALEQLSAWKDWCQEVRVLGDLGALTFQNTHDLHADSGRIGSLLDTYLQLKEQARDAGVE